MTLKQSKSDEPFLLDDPSVSLISTTRIKRSLGLFGKLTRIYIALFSIAIPLAIFAVLSPTLSWIWLITISLSFVLYFFRFSPE